MIWLLVLANAGYFAWTQGYLGALGLKPVVQSEPERLRSQIKPEGLRLLNAPRPAEAPSNATAPTAAPPSPPAPEAEAEATAASTVAAAEVPAKPQTDNTPATACWQAAIYSPAQAEVLRTALQQLGLPDGAWRLNEVLSGGRWIVYMGRYNDEQMARKKTELRDIKIEFREVTVPALGRGLALGTFSSEASAEQALQDLSKKGVRTARVAVERPEGTNFVLRLPAATAAQRAQVAGLGAALAGKTLQACE
ncbi:SPOR domain-containing protein [Hydrogenophaga aromaticivorans]|uniref:SPOR domain-containing protein n=1 Tax=Hydrogenophaga aromaticivorans TaxID=2610898 RepID=UPI0031EF2DC1